jgi:aspartate-semialdehyde dehydrogenase
MSFMRAFSIAIIGATGAVGSALIKLLEEGRFPVSELRLAASPHSRERQVRFRGETRIVESIEEISDADIDIAFFSAGGAMSTHWAPRFAARGALVIDNSNAFRLKPEVPLVVPQINANALSTRPKSGIVANPNCSTIQLVRALRPLAAAFPISQIVLTTYQAASGGGLRGIDELLGGARSTLDGVADLRGERFPVALSFNVIPQIGEISEDGVTLEERKLVQESRKILKLPRLRVTATCVRVPVVNGHSEAVYIEFEKSVSLEQAQKVLAEEVGIRLYADGVRKGYPTPRLLDHPGDVHVGRVRINPDNARGLWMWVVADNLQVGAALNAVLIAELAIANKIIGAS